MNIVFFDIKESVLSDFESIIGKVETSLDSGLPFSTLYVHTDVRQLLKQGIAQKDGCKPVDIVVSPANSHGFMDGGIDMVLYLHFKFLPS